MMISALITRGDGGDEAIYALLTAHSRVQPYDLPLLCTLIRGPDQQRIPLGTLVPANEVLGDGGDKLGFHGLRLYATPLFGDLRQHSKSLATVSDFQKGIWSAGTFRVRRLNDALAFSETSTKRRRSIDFVTLGDDWPKLKVSPKRRALA